MKRNRLAVVMQCMKPEGWSYRSKQRLRWVFFITQNVTNTGTSLVRFGKVCVADLLAFIVSSTGSVKAFEILAWLNRKLQKSFLYCVDTLQNWKRLPWNGAAVWFSRCWNVCKVPAVFIMNWICWALMHRFSSIMHVCASFQFDSKEVEMEWQEFTEIHSTSVIKYFFKVHKIKLIGSMT